MTREGTGVAGMYPAFLFDCANGSFNDSEWVLNLLVC